MATKYQRRIENRRFLDQRKQKPKFTPQEIVNGSKPEKLKEILELLHNLCNHSMRKSQEFIILYSKLDERCGLKISQKEIQEAKDYIKHRDMFYFLGPLSYQTRKKINSL